MGLRGPPLSIDHNDMRQGGTRGYFWRRELDLNQRPFPYQGNALTTELSHRPTIWRAREGLNLRPLPYQGSALPPELLARPLLTILERETGFEPVTSRLATWGSTN